jgi:hypothetical protein
MVSNAHASATPHHVGQTTKARIALAALLDGAPHPDALAARLVDAVLDLGWTPPPDPGADIPPLRPAQPAGDHSPGRLEFLAAKAALAERPRRDT